MGSSIEIYNAGVDAAQRREGRLPTREPQGARMRWNAWKGREHRPRQEASE
jgi:hypothetical protein